MTIERRGRTPICRARNDTIKEIRKYYELRKSADPSFTTTKFAILLGISGGTLRAWFSTKTNPTLNVWQAFENLINYAHPVSYSQESIRMMPVPERMIFFCACGCGKEWVRYSPNAIYHPDCRK